MSLFIKTIFLKKFCCCCFFFKTHFKFIYLFIFGCVGSSSLREGPLQLRRAGATPHRGARASHRRGPSCCGAQAPDAQAQQLRLTGPAAPRHVGSSQTRARTRVPCSGRQTLNHCATREAPLKLFIEQMLCANVTCVLFKSRRDDLLIYNMYLSEIFNPSRCCPLKGLFTVCLLMEEYSLI